MHDALLVADTALLADRRPLTRDEALAVERMRTHLEGVREAVRRWDPEKHPVV